MNPMNNEYIVTLHISDSDELTSFLLCELLSKQNKVKIEGVLCLTPVTYIEKRNYTNVVRAIKQHTKDLKDSL